MLIHPESKIVTCSSSSLAINWNAYRRSIEPHEATEFPSGTLLIQIGIYGHSRSAPFSKRDLDLGPVFDVPFLHLAGRVPSETAIDPFHPDPARELRWPEHQWRHQRQGNRL